MRWSGQSTRAQDDGALPGLGIADVAAVPGHLRTVRPPEFQGVAFHEVLAKSALNRVPAQSSMPFQWTINPYRGCSHACVYCFARGSHRYLDFDTGEDFDTQIVVKVNVAEVLGRELARPSWGRETVALGTNTDPYQRAEGRYRLMPGIAQALGRSGTPFSILTKGTLLRRDLPLLSEIAQRVPVHLAMSIAVGDPELQQLVEPGTPTTRARLETVAAARAAGFAVDVFVMPVLPYLTDSAAQLDALLRDVREAGAASVMYGPLHLRTHVKPWFFEWLQHTHPELLPAYRALYPGAASRATEAYRKQLGARIRPLIRRHGLERASGSRARAAPMGGMEMPDGAGIGDAGFGGAGAGDAGFGGAGAGDAGANGAGRARGAGGAGVRQLPSTSGPLPPLPPLPPRAPRARVSGAGGGAAPPWEAAPTLF